MPNQEFVSSNAGKGSRNLLCQTPWNCGFQQILLTEEIKLLWTLYKIKKPCIFPEIDFHCLYTASSNRHLRKTQNVIPAGLTRSARQHNYPLTKPIPGYLPFIPTLPLRWTWKSTCSGLKLSDLLRRQNWVFHFWNKAVSSEGRADKVDCITSGLRIWTTWCHSFISNLWF